MACKACVKIKSFHIYELIELEIAPLEEAIVVKNYPPSCTYPTFNKIIGIMNSKCPECD